MNNHKYRGSTVTSPSLVIFSVNENDAGTYLCGATNGAGSSESNAIALQVSGSKYIIVYFVMCHVVCHAVCYAV